MLFICGCDFTRNVFLIVPLLYFNFRFISDFLENKNYNCVIVAKYPLIFHYIILDLDALMNNFMIYYLNFMLLITYRNNI